MLAFLKKNKQTVVSIVAIMIMAAIAFAPSVDAKKKKKKSSGGSAVAQIATNGVNGAHILDGSVSSADLTDGTVATSDLADNAVTTGKISDGTVVNADVADSAAIAGAKISPDFGAQNVASTGTGTFGSLWSNAINSAGASSPLVLGATYPSSSYTLLDTATYVSGFLDVQNSFYLSSFSGASSTAATNTTQPSETCNDAAYIGRIEIVDDTDSPGAWTWICEQTGASSYGWYRIQ